MPPHDCAQKEHVEKLEAKIDKIDTRLGNGDVSLAMIHQTLKQVLEQTTKTNGRVTELERKAATPRMNAAAAVTVITCTTVVCGSVFSLVIKLAGL